MILFWFLLSGFAHATLPVAETAQFPLDRRWEWAYFRKATGELYSTERYTVVGHDEKYLWLEMSSQYGGVGEFVVHHRLRVVLASCLAAYRNPADFKPWAPTLYYRDPGTNQWLETSGNRLAFEEKFNCNPHERTRYHRVEKRAGEFRHLKWGKLPGSWFGESGAYAATATEKDFGEYIFRLKK